MLDFSSALYLGMTHASASLDPWARLTEGVPAALAEPPGAAALSARLAAWTGCARALVAPSTLHLVWDLFGALVEPSWAVYWDEGAYPITRWGVERSAARGAFARGFAHHDPDALSRAIQATRGARRPVVVADGYCPACGAAPLTGYLEVARRHGGWLIVDDTQALGLYGRVARGAVYGSGGGGSLRRHRLAGEDTLVVGSLAKALGVPVAVVAGSDAAVRRFEARSETRVHCSPVSAAVIRAAERALDVNVAEGDLRRSRLARNVRRFAARLREAGHRARGGFFPVQRVTSVAGRDAAATHARLLRAGVRTVLQRARCEGEAAVTFVLTARHTPAQVDHAVALLAEVTRAAPWMDAVIGDQEDEP